LPATQLVAEDGLSNAVIAEAVGIKEGTLYTWKRDPAFAERVDQHVDAIQRRVRKYGFARLDHRLGRYTKRLEAIDQIFTERGTAMVESELRRPRRLAKFGKVVSKPGLRVGRVQ
jgi:hypothetical protein